jgi:hypothetical protein
MEYVFISLDCDGDADVITKAAEGWQILHTIPAYVDIDGYHFRPRVVMGRAKASVPIKPTPAPGKGRVQS